MKKRRRIEITAFRRCTTIVLHDQSEAWPAGRPPGDGDLPSLMSTDQARAAKNDLAQTQITNPEEFLDENEKVKRDDRSATTADQKPKGEKPNVSH